MNPHRHFLQDIPTPVRQAPTAQTAQSDPSQPGDDQSAELPDARSKLFGSFARQAGAAAASPPTTAPPAAAPIPTPAAKGKAAAKSKATAKAKATMEGHSQQAAALLNGVKRHADTPTPVQTAQGSTTTPVIKFARVAEKPGEASSASAETPPAQKTKKAAILSLAPERQKPEEPPAKRMRTQEQTSGKAGEAVQNGSTSADSRNTAPEAEESNGTSKSNAKAAASQPAESSEDPLEAMLSDPGSLDTDLAWFKTQAV